MARDDTGKRRKDSLGRRSGDDNRWLWRRKRKLEPDEGTPKRWDDESQEPEDDHDDGESGGLSILTIVGAVVMVIVIVAVAIPVTQDAVANMESECIATNSTACITGPTVAILNLIPLFIGLGALVVVLGLFSGIFDGGRRE